LSSAALAGVVDRRQERPGLAQRHERRRPSAATNFAQKWPPTSGAAVSH
jgi:hypothetical protein